MPDEPRLREQAREAIKGGRLPRQAPDRTWGGPGVNPGLDKFHVHIRCFAAWEFERNKPGL